MTMYQNKQNGKVMEIVKRDEEKGTMIIKFTDGKTSCITTGTFKRWYKAFEVPETVETLDVESEDGLTGDEALEQAVVEPEGAYAATEYMHNLMKQAKEEELAGDGTPLAQVGKEIAEQAKQKAKTVKQTRQTKEAQIWVEEAKEYVFGLVTKQGDEVFVPNNIPMRSFKVGGHMYARFNFSKSSVSLGLKSTSIKKGVKEPDAHLNHMFDAVYNFRQALTDQDKELIATLLAGAREQRIAKNNK